MRDRLCVAAVLLAWHLPVLYHGVVSPRPLPGVPWNLHRCHDITCLFTDKPSARSHYYVQVRRVGRPDWQTLDISEHFPMRVARRGPPAESFPYNRRRAKLLR